MKDFKNIEIVEAYLECEITGQDHEQFEQAMAVDEKLSEMVLNSKCGIQAIRIAGQMELKIKLQEIHESEIGTSKVRMLPVFMKYAAIFVAIAFIGILAWYSFSAQNNYSKLYSQNFEAYTNLLTVKGENIGTSEQSLVNTAMYQYDLKNYENANRIFQQLLTFKQNNDTILFYNGISQLASDHTEEAIFLFGRLLQQKESLFYRFGHAKWYLALAYLKEAGKVQNSKSLEKEKEMAELVKQSKKLLTEIVAKNGDYSADAQKMLQKLK